ncbi:MAG: hypothetical protein KGZ51_00875 [Erysipelothrix sp.]|jgi:hypothetical protein|nr:hypothetical protein [Erysipelothrix sp.]
MNAVEAMKARRLVRYAYEIYDLKPWEHKDKLGIILIQLNNRKTPYYVVFLEESIVVLPNVAALIGLFLNAQYEHMPSIQRLRYQQHLLCTFVHPSEVDDVMMELFTSSEASVREDVLPMFESTMPSLLPDVLVKKEIDVLVDVYVQALSAIKEILEEDQTINFDEQMHTWNFSFDENRWVLSSDELPSSNLDVEPLVLDSHSTEIINNAQQLDDEWEVDIAYTSIMLEPQENHRQHAIRLGMIAHHEAPYIYAQGLIKEDNHPHLQLLESFVNVIKERGKPKKIFVRDQIMLEVMTSLCESVNIEIQESEVLNTIDIFVEELSESMM